MFLVAVGIISFVCLLLILVVLLQSSKSSGAAGGFSSNLNYLVGANRKGDLLENITWGLAVTLIVGCISTNFLLEKNNDGTVQVESANIERAQESGFAPQQQQQAAPAGQAQPQEEGK
ncbi:MAG: preprotein translocase subunit SecG [Bacteroidota bacterium]|nr:preprotein translocase subunit SecG [Bacteroidota bacterium]